MSHRTKCDTNSKVRAMSATPFPAGTLKLTQPHSQVRKRKHGRSSTVMPWTTTDELNVIPMTYIIWIVSYLEGRKEGMKEGMRK